MPKGLSAIFLKDLRLHLANPECLFINVLLSITILLLIRFAVGSDNLSGIASGAYWVTFFISGNLTLNRIIQLETQDGCADAVILSGVSANTVFIARLLTSFIFFGISQAVVYPVYALFFSELTWSGFVSFLPIFFGVMLGFNAIMSVLTFLFAEIRFSEILLPVIGFPIQIPILLAGIVLTDRISSFLEFPDTQNWIIMIVAFDIIYLCVVYILNVLVYD